MPHRWPITGDHNTGIRAVTRLDSARDRGDSQRMKSSTIAARDHHRHFRPMRPHSALGRMLEVMSRDVTTFTFSSWAFAVAALVIVGWLVRGPFFHYSG